MKFTPQKKMRRILIVMTLLMASQNETRAQVDVVPAAAEAVVNIGFTVAKAIGDVERRGIIEIKNFTPYDLEEIKYYEESGSVHLYPLTIPSNKASVVGVKKSQGSATGAVGVVSYKLKGTNSRIAICYSIPYDYNLYSNWYKYSIISSNTRVDKKLYDDMYNNRGKLTSGEIKKASSGFNKWHRGEFTMSGAMTNNGQSTLRMELRSSAPAPAPAPAPVGHVHTPAPAFTTTANPNANTGFPKGTFHMTTMLVEGEKLAFESNRGLGAEFLKGASHMASQGNYTGQMWKAIPAGNGYFHLTTEFVEKENLVLEGNKVAPGNTLGGAAFMAKKNNTSGQMWKAIPIGNGYYYLTTMFTEKENLVFEGNKVAPESAHSGAAFMTTKANCSGQMWKFIAK